jgi:hypothetical protein
MLILTYIMLVMTHGEAEVARKENISKEAHRFSPVVLLGSSPSRISISGGRQALPRQKREERVRMRSGSEPKLTVKEGVEGVLKPKYDDSKKLWASSNLPPL